MKKNNRIFALAMACLMLLAALTGCASKGGESTAPATQAPSTQAPATQAPTTQTQAEETAVPTTEELPATRIFTDSVGREVEIPTNIQHILPAGNMAAMFMWPLCSDKLASLASAFSDSALKYYGQQYKDLPITGDLYKTGSKMNVEEVARLNPDIIIDFGEPKATITEDLNNLQELLGIPCVFIEGSFSNSGNAYRMLGDLLGNEETAHMLGAYCDDIYARMTEIADSVEKKDLLYITGEGHNVIAQ